MKSLHQALPSQHNLTVHMSCIVCTHPRLVACLISGSGALQDYDRQLFNSFAAGKTPDLIITSPGAHDCFHYPVELAHHGLELRRYYQHLHLVRMSCSPYIEL